MNPLGRNRPAAFSAQRAPRRRRPGNTAGGLPPSLSVWSGRKRGGRTPRVLVTPHVAVAHSSDRRPLSGQTGRERGSTRSQSGIATRPDGRGSLTPLRCRHSPSARPARSAASPGSCVRAWPSRVAHQCTHDVEDAGARCFVLDAAAPVRSRWSYVDHRVVFDERVTSLAEIQVNTPQ